MKALLLAAGYGTRLGEVGRDTPKALLPVAGRPLLDHLVDILRDLPALDELRLVTNHRFHATFAAWAVDQPPPPIRLLDDGSTGPEDRLGAIRDLQLGLEHWSIPREGLLVCATDNLVRFPLARAAEAYARRQTSTLVLLEESDPQRLRRTGVVTLDPQDRVLTLEEKPPEPRSNLICPAFYFLTARALARVEEYLAQPHVPGDAPGHFISWLVQKEPVFGARLPGSRVDIGSPDDLKSVISP